MSHAISLIIQHWFLFGVLAIVLMPLALAEAFLMTILAVAIFGRSRPGHEGR